MRLRDCLHHPNFVASALEMSDMALEACAHRAMCVQDILQNNHTNYMDEWYTHDVEDWQGNMLSLMLLRDCLGREMVRRGLEPPGPPMLVRGWETRDIRPMSNDSCSYAPPSWITEKKGTQR